MFPPPTGQLHLPKPQSHPAHLPVDPAARGGHLKRQTVHDGGRVRAPPLFERDSAEIPESCRAAALRTDRGDRISDGVQRERPGRPEDDGGETGVLRETDARVRV